MNHRNTLRGRRWRGACAGVALAALAGTAAAQGGLLRPGYAGINIGKPSLDTPCAPGFTCDDASASAHLYFGRMLSTFLGVEVGYFNAGEADRSGGTTEAHGINLSVLGSIPVGPVDLFAKGGTIYGRTEVTASPAAGVSTGSETGFGPTYGVGVGMNLAEHSRIVLQWDRFEFKFNGRGRESVETTSLGYVWRF